MHMGSRFRLRSSCKSEDYRGSEFECVECWCLKTKQLYGKGEVRHSRRIHVPSGTLRVIGGGTPPVPNNFSKAVIHPTS